MRRIQNTDEGRELDRDWGKLVLLLEEDKRLTKEEERRNWDRQAVGEKSEEEKLNIKRRHH